MSIGKALALLFLVPLAASPFGCASAPPPPPEPPKPQAFTCPPGATWDGSQCKTQNACEVEQTAATVAALQAAACVGEADCEKQCNEGTTRSCTDFAKKLDKKSGGITERSLELYKKSCFAGDGEGCFKLASGYQYGYGGLEKDRARSMELYRQACNCRNADGCTDQGFGTQYGEGVPKDEHRAAELYDRACELGSFIGCKNIGWMYETATGVEKDMDKAIALYDKACAGDHDNGCYNAAIAYEHQTPPNDAKAATNYKKACELGVATACTSYGYMVEKGKGGLTKSFEIAGEYYKRGCEKQNSYGCSNSGVMWEFGLGTGRKDVGKAMEYYEQGCKLGLALACEKKTTLMASLQRECDALSTKPKTPTFGKKAADAPPPTEGCTNLGYLYEHGTGVPKDERLASDYYKKSCDAKLPIGCQNLGNIFDAGRVVPQDLKKAAELYKKACDLGSSGGCNNLGLKYEYGTGVAKSPPRALDLYKKACEKGLTIACNNVRYLAARLEADKSKSAFSMASGVRNVVSHGASSGASDSLQPITAPK